jgi:hypothetical protein
VYLFVGRSLNATPVQLGTLTLCRAMVQVRGLTLTCTAAGSACITGSVVQQQTAQHARHPMQPHAGVDFLATQSFQLPFLPVLYAASQHLPPDLQFNPCHHLPPCEPHSQSVPCVTSPPVLVSLPPWLHHQTLSSPLSGILGDRYDRILVLSTGAFIWAIMTSAMALTVTLRQVRHPGCHTHEQG